MKEFQYLKDQAQRKMEQKLAELGINKPAESPSQQSLSPLSQMEAQATPVKSPFQETQHADERSEDSEDEEEKRLREELERIKLKKKADKEKRLAELRRQVQDAQAESDDGFSSSVSGSNNGNVLAPQVEGTVGHVEYPAVPSAANPVSSVSASMSGSSTPVQGTSAAARNPFFKSTDSSNSTSGLSDLKAAEAQRRSQRGLDDDADAWSDDEPSPVAPAPVAPAPVAPAPVAPAPAPVPVAPSPAAPQPSNLPPVPIAPPLPQVQGVPQPVVPLAPPLPQVKQEEQGNFLAPPPSLPHMDNIQNSQNLDSHSDQDDVLSIPDSVASEDELGDEPGLPPSGIPPPPPLP
ncbi:hypothetical protein Kpol_150p2 [Vanderwaltozyma polyspora DSM 70294]|uniref:Uncharacterized protein n=1 Tax=Vanderwaltozyma polyspora (strain ATCC 22028 / DSM 70294 / BCRC 21397 / CBS 2163 / NBRC 10782 / NRRL Y-8283 / UCD 57-17) TaxID=436907 RepID=A7TTU9_VANPO|nr:uncharacterized protein Kpol_150p2 [Vanderwaltozyma polyspora DSM 70294]EDO14309.1 hypothetical protein Kpol_150p2 [Vanderwaltozyma polyspora DSM 70294]